MQATEQKKKIHFGKGTPKMEKSTEASVTMEVC